MSDFIWFLMGICVIAVAAYKQTTLLNTLIAMSVIMVVGTLAGDIGLLGWLVFLLFSVPLANPSIRQKYISSKLLAFYKKVSPEMSETEQEAIDAGIGAEQKKQKFRDQAAKQREKIKGMKTNEIAN